MLALRRNDNLAAVVSDILTVSTRVCNLFYFKLKCAYTTRSPSPPLQIYHVLPLPLKCMFLIFLIGMMIHIYELIHKYGLLSLFNVACWSSYFVKDILVCEHVELMI